MAEAEKYWKKLEKDQQVLLENQFKRKQRENEYLGDLERQMQDQEQAKIAREIEAKKPYLGTLQMDQKVHKCYNCA